jgi:hypothetical protein
MRLGFILGFLIGGGVAALMARMQERGAAGRESPLVGRVRHQFEEARDAAREAQLEKEAEMRREFDELVHREGKQGGG